MVLSSLSSLLALNRTVGVVLISVLFFGLGEQLWSPFLPAYLEAKTNSGGASSMGGVSFAALLAIGVYACLRNLFEAACYVGGGELTARLGDRGSLILFGLITVGGYALFLWFWLGPHALLYLAFAFGCAGAAVFYVCVREPSAMPKSSTTSIESLTDATLR